MAHGLEIIDGVASMFYNAATERLPWWWRDGLVGVKFDQAPSSVAVALGAMRADFRVSTAPLQVADSDVIVLDHVAVIRNDTGKVLGVVGRKYVPSQQHELFSQFTPFIEENLAELSSGGVLDNGARVWMQMRVIGGEEEVAPGDTVKTYLHLSNSHDGKSSHKIGMTDTAIVCNNTLHMANSQIGVYGVRHSSQAKNKIASHIEALRKELSLFKERIQLYKTLTTKKATDQRVEAYFAKLFKAEPIEIPIHHEPQQVELPVERERERVLVKVQDLYHGQMQGFDTVEARRGTWWGAFNAATEFEQQHRGHNTSSKLRRNIFGTSVGFANKALHLALQA